MKKCNKKYELIETENSKERKRELYLKIKQSFNKSERKK